MKICTITSHDVYNYGASLQAFALMTFLKNRGHDVHIIDYIPRYEIRRYTFSHIHEGTIYDKLCRKVPFLRRFIAIIYNRKDFLFLKRKRTFDKFTKCMLNLTSKTYHCNNDLIQDKPYADLYIAGSDQIWNTNHGKGKDPAFYLDFVHDQSRCISYAASFATPYICSQYVEFVRNGLKNFRSISVRERTGVEIAGSLGYSVTQVLDPTFLLSRREWESIVNNNCEIVNAKSNDSYLLLYNFVEEASDVDNYAIKLAREKGLKIISLNDGYIRNFADKNINNAGPLEFVWWIKNADVVVSNSFHATVFSIIFNVDFYTFPLTGANSSSRMSDLLSLLKLENRFMGTEHKTRDIKWQTANSILCCQIESSKEWLLSNI